MSVMYKRAKHIFLLAVVILSTAASSLIPADSAFAATTSVYIDPTAKADALVSIYRVSMALCLRAGDGENLRNFQVADKGDIASGNWFRAGDPTTRPGVFVNPNGYVDCSTLVKNHPAAATLGWDSNIAFACGLGLQRINKSPCLTGGEVNGATNDNFNYGTIKSKDDVYRAIDAHIQTTHGFNNVQLYVMAAETYRVECKATPIVNVQEANPDQQNSNLQDVKVVDNQGNLVHVFYKKGNNDDHDFRNDEKDFHYITEDCNWMKDRMNQYAEDYQTWVKAHQPGQSGIPGTCEEAFAGKDAEIKACQAGFANKADTGYCQVHYQPFNVPSAEYTACLYGQNKATSPTGTTAPPATENPDGDGKPSCAIEGIGWLVCPVLNFLGPVVDESYGFVSKLLTVQPLVTTGGGGIYDAWSAVRNIANIVFVIAFLIIIFSQLTSVGITNYGIKKMLPRLIIAAILVNVSYWVCAIAIDLSNIIGSSINGVFQGFKNGLPTPDVSLIQGGSNWTGIITFILAGAVAVYIGLSALLPALIVVLMTIVTVLVVLTVRQALIILLVVISPLAFVAYLLPNTESLFHKWRKLFQTLLLMYPIIGFIFGGAALASKIVSNSAPQGDKYAIAIQIMGAMVAVVPLALTPIIMKSAGGALNKVGAFVNNPNKGPFDRMRKGAEGFRNRQEGRREIRALSGSKVARRTSFGKYGRAAKREAMGAGVEAERRRARGAYVATTAEDNEAFRNRLAGGRTFGPNASPEALNRALASAITVQAKIEAEEVTAASAVIKNMNLDRNMEAMRTVSMGGSAEGLDGSNHAIRAAAMKNVIDSHSVDGVNDLLDNVGNMDQKTRTSFADSLAASSQKPQYVSQGALTAIRRNGELDENGKTIKAQSSVELAIDAVNNNTYSVNNIANGDKDELKYIAKIASDDRLVDRAGDRVIGDAKRQQLATNANTAKNEVRYQGQVGKNIDVVDAISQIT